MKSFFTKNRILVAATIVIALSLIPLFSAHRSFAQSGNQWRADYFPNQDWAGNPVYTQYSNLINFNWEYGSPAPNIPADYFSGRFTTDAYFYAGTYRFSFVAGDEAVFMVDNAIYVDTRGTGQSGKTIVVDIVLSQGTHRVQVDYREIILTAYVYVDWQYLKDDTVVVYPTPTPAPPTQGSATSVVTQYGDYTPCIQQNIHQSNCFQSNGEWDSPNLGSIQTEPQIVVWGNCAADSVTTFTVDPVKGPESFKCSKTEAGWFRN